jgi:spore cortex formation protein SpoVR/YcgB (stage V sporulation)
MRWGRQAKEKVKEEKVSAAAKDDDSRQTRFVAEHYSNTAGRRQAHPALPSTNLLRFIRLESWQRPFVLLLPSSKKKKKQAEKKKSGSTSNTRA